MEEINNKKLILPYITVCPKCDKNLISYDVTFNKQMIINCPQCGPSYEESGIKTTIIGDILGSIIGIKNIVVPKLELPLLYIPSIPRMGGTLLRNLFDYHNNLAVHHGELRLSLYPNMGEYPKFTSPNIVDNIARNLQRLSYNLSYKIGDLNHMCLLPPALVLHNYAILIKKNKPESNREIMNDYFTAYFRSWLDCRFNLNNKKYVVGFSSNSINFSEGISTYFDDYPDGKMVIPIRNPKTWAPSYIRRFYEDDSKPTNIGDLLNYLSVGLDNIKEVKKNYGDKVYIVEFEKLLTDTENQMRSIAKFIDIPYNNILCHPTFNGYQTKSNSSFNSRFGVDKGPLDRYKDFEDKDNLIEKFEKSIYKNFKERVL